MKLTAAILLGALLLVFVGVSAARACENCPNTCVGCQTMATCDDYLTRVAMTEALLRLPESERKQLISHMFKNYKRACKAEEKARMRSAIFYNIYQASVAEGRVSKVAFVTKNSSDLVAYVPEFALNIEEPVKTSAKAPAVEKIPMGSYCMWTVDSYGNPTSEKKIFEVSNRWHTLSL